MLVATRRVMVRTRKRGVAAAFDPLSLSPALWLKDTGYYQERTGASATTPAAADGDPIGSWLDQSGNARHLTAGADSRRPTLKLTIQNGRSVARFDGTDDTLKAVFTLDQPHTRFVVALNRSAQDNNHIMLDGGVNDAAYSLWSAANTPQIAAGIGLNGSTADGTLWHVWRCTYHGAASKIQLDAGTVTTGNAGASNAGGISLAAQGATTNFPTDCDIAEVLEFASALSDADVSLVLAYLNARWAVY